MLLRVVRNIVVDFIDFRSGAALKVKDAAMAEPNRGAHFAGLGGAGLTLD